MVTLREALARLVSFFRKDHRDREFDQELASHIEMATEEHLRLGISVAEARRLALVKLGGIEPAKQLHRESRGLPFVDHFIQDIRYAIRTLWRSPGFTVAAVATLAIGIGATTAIFSTVNATLLRPLPFPRQNQLVDVRTRFTNGNVTTGLVSNAEIVALNGLTSVVVRAAGMNQIVSGATLIRDDNSPVSVTASGVTEGFFETMELPLAQGRSFTKEEHARGGRNAPMVAVISDRAWERLFGRDPNLVGKSVPIAEAGASALVVGIASPALDFPTGTDLWFNLRGDPRDASHGFNAVVRLRPGATLDQLRAAGAGAMTELAKTIPNDVGREYVLQPLLTAMVGDLRPILLIVLGATSLLLLLACVNVTNLLLARGMARTHEIAMRTALGASRGRVVAQLVTQSMVLSTVGSLAGLAVAYAGVRLLLLLGASKLPRLDAVPFDWRVLLFTLAVLLVSGVLMGIGPALRLSRTDLKTAISATGRRTTASPAASRMMSSMIVAEIALAIALVAGAGWLIQSFSRLRSTDPGFTADGRLVVDVRPARRFGSPAEARAWVDELTNRVRASAPSSTVGAASSFPMRDKFETTTNLEVDGDPADPARIKTVRLRAVTPGFFDAMNTRLLAGRHFTADDRIDTQLVAVVNRAFVQRYLAQREPLTGTLFFGFPDVDRKRPFHVIGVVEDMKYLSLADSAEPTMFLAPAQLPFPPTTLAFVVNPPGGNPAAVVSSIRAELTRFDPQAVVAFTAADQIVKETTGRQELGMTLMIIFGVTALVLAAIGLYGVIAYAATQRRNELATRMALGASGGQVFWLMVSNGQRLTLLGLGIGLALAYGAGRIVASNVFAMRAADPIVLITAAVIVVGVTWVATVIPAIRASRQDPLRALRAE